MGDQAYTDPLLDDDGGLVAFAGCTFAGNSAKDVGGAVAWAFRQLSDNRGVQAMRDCVFENNTA